MILFSLTPSLPWRRAGKRSHARGALALERSRRLRAGRVEAWDADAAVNAVAEHDGRSAAGARHVEVAKLDV